MLLTVFNEPYWLLNNGIGQNLVANPVWLVIGGLIFGTLARKAYRVLLSHHEHQSRMLEEIHHLAHTGKEHPRVTNRKDNGEDPTPKRREVS